MQEWESGISLSGQCWRAQLVELRSKLFLGTSGVAWLLEICLPSGFGGSRFSFAFWREMDPAFLSLLYQKAKEKRDPQNYAVTIGSYEPSSGLIPKETNTGRVTFMRWLKRWRKTSTCVEKIDCSTFVFLKKKKRKKSGIHVWIPLFFRFLAPRQKTKKSGIHVSHDLKIITQSKSFLLSKNHFYSVKIIFTQ